MKNIIFTSDAIAPFIQKEFYPCPAIKQLPNWYKNMSGYEGEPKTAHQRRESATMKRCMPLLDAMSAGYYLKTFTELSIETTEQGLNFNWAFAPDIDYVTYHSLGAVSGYKDLDLRLGAPKLYNPWCIATPPGYSVLIIPPMHQPSIGIRILEGVVDTDTYTHSIQLPFLVDENFTGDIPAGTPVAQVIPFKRDDFKMSIGKDEDRQKSLRIGMSIRSNFQNGYKSLYRKKKNYS
jgi:hypothetical protein